MYLASREFLLPGLPPRPAVPVAHSRERYLPEDPETHSGAAQKVPRERSQLSHRRLSPNTQGEPAASTLGL